MTINEQITGTEVVHGFCKKEKKLCHSILASSRFWNKRGFGEAWDPRDA